MADDEGDFDGYTDGGGGGGGGSNPTCGSFGVTVCGNPTGTPGAQGSPQDIPAGLVRGVATVADLNALYALLGVTPGENTADWFDNLINADRNSGAYGFGEFVLAGLPLVFVPGDEFAGSANAAKAARTFTSTDPHVADVANTIEKAMPGRVEGVNSKLMMSNGLKREIDIDLGSLVIQVKSGNARGLQGQLEKTTETTGRTAVGYAPDIPNGAWEASMRNGIPIARNSDELLAIIRELQ